MAGYKTPKLGKYCPKCNKKVANGFHVCPCCGHAFVSVKTTRVINKPAKSQGVDPTRIDAIVALSEAGFKAEQIAKLLLS